MPTSDRPDFHYFGYRIVHHMGAAVQHIQEFGFNAFDHPPIADHLAFVITPALDHFYTKAIADLRHGPVVIETAPKDDRYSSLQIFDMEHHTIFDQVTDPAGERFALVHADYDGEVPDCPLIKTTSLFPYVFIRTQSFAFNADATADRIRRESVISGETSEIELPDPTDTLGLIAWTIANSGRYPQTADLIAEAAASYTPAIHKETFEDVKAFLRSGGVTGNPGMFEAVDDPAGGSHKVRAAGTLMGHLGLPVHHAYYQQVPVDRSGTLLSGANGPFAVTLPHDPGVDLFWSVTRYGADTFRPLDPADTGGNETQAFNAFNTEPDGDGKVTITFSMDRPEDGSYWMPVIEGGYYWIARYYGPAEALNGNTAHDIIYGGTPLQERFAPVRF